MGRPWDITGDEIQIWSQRVEASAVLPDLVRRLLLATSPIGTVDMRADGGTRLAGWDGIVQALRATAFCPRGQSVWEMSVEGTRSKLDDDFTKRTDTPPAPVRPAATTYVAVLARRFRDKRSWAGDRRAGGRWIDVRLLDADDLAAWLTQAPAVARWFGAQLDKPAYDAVDLDTFVARWRARTSPPLPIGLLLGGRERERAAEQVRSWARSGRPQPLFVRGDTKEEAVVFSAAALALAPSPEGDLWRARTLVVESEAALRWAYRVAQAEPLIVLPAFDGMDAKLVERTAFVVVPLDSAAGSGGVLRPLTLEAVPYRRITEILVEGGLPRDEAERRAEESGGKLSALQRLYGYVSLPAWAAPLDPVPLAAMLLAGAYQPENEADREVIRALGAEPRDVESLCERLRIIPDAATVRDQERWGRATWKWSAEGDAWKALVGSIPAETLRRFQNTATAVLGKVDPRFELDPDERFAAELHGKVLQESPALREGLVRALVRLSLHDEDLAVLHGSRGGSTVASTVVRRLLEPGWVRWASLADLLPLLAEAAPEVFLDRLEESLRQGDEGAAHLLAEEGRFGSPHTGLLWALETLGWSELYMARVAEALVTLTEHDMKLPDKLGRMANRPAASFHNLVHFAWAQTRAPAEARRAVLQRMASRPLGYDFIIGQLASVNRPGMMMPAHPPEFRPWTPPDEAALQQRASLEATGNVEALVSLALDHVGADAKMWVQLLDAAHELPEPFVKRIFERLEMGSAVIVDSEATIWAALRQWLHENAVGEDGAARRQPIWYTQVLRLYEEVFRPVDFVARSAWLFGAMVDLPDYSDVVDAEDERLKALRSAVLRQVWDSPDRWDLLLRLVAKVRMDQGQAWLIAEQLGQAEFAEEMLDWLLKDRAGDSMLLAAFLYGRMKTPQTPEWIEHVLDRIVQKRGIDVAADVIWRQRPTNRLWDAIDKLGEQVRARYWSAVFYVADEEKDHDWERAVRDLLKHGNLLAALNAVEQGKTNVSVEMASQVLEALRTNADAIQRVLGDRLVLHRLERVISRLERDSAADASLVEYFGSLLAMTSADPGRTQHRLSTVIERDFLSLVRQLYRPEGEAKPPPGAERTAREQEARAAYRMLEAWRGYPGQGLPAEAREDHLHTWSTTMLDVLATEGRGAVGAIEVAKILARAPVGEDEHWPCLAARRLLESGAYPRLADGLHTAKRNLRGVVSKSIGEGGKQEREIAAAFHRSAEILRIECPRTAAMLDSLARSYGDEAEQEDERARADLREAGAEPEDFAEPKSAPEAQAAQPFLPGVIELGPTSLKNIRIIEELPLDFARAQDHRGQWIVLVGENGSGKSSILRALALTLTTYGVAVHGHGDLPAGLVGSSGNVGACTVVCNGEEYRLTLTKGAREVELKQEPNGTTPRPLVFGYGCRRGSIFGGPRVADIERVTSDIDTLFNELVRIFPTFDWLKRQKLRALQEPAYAPIYERLMDGICSLLPDVERIDIYGDDLWAIAPKLGGDVSVAALSDGYLTTIGWVVDLIARWFERAKELHVPVDKDFFENMTGVVLLDEPDLHLHPRWQMRVISDVRRLFKSMTFVVTTHNPFTLFGARAEEIWLLERDANDKIVARQSRARPPLMTGSDLYETYFGMTTVFPNELGEMLDRYTFIARNPVRSDVEDADLLGLLTRLRDAGVEPGMQPVPREPLSSDPTVTAP